MSNIDKQALRERYSPKPAPECHICGAEMTIQRMSAGRITYGCTGATYDDKGCHYAEGRSIADDHYEQSRVTVVDVSDPDVLALLDELEKTQRANVAQDDHINQQQDRIEQLEKGHQEAAKQINSWRRLAKQNIAERGKDISELEAARQRIAELTDQKAAWVSWAENASGMVDMLRLRIAELEHSETQLINERDSAESALADMYQAATGERPEWSNMFGFADAVDVVEERLATLEANQSQTTPTGIQLITEAIGAHGYIVGCLLQGRPDLALEESRKWVSAFGQAAEIVSAQDAAGIGKGD
ncbi:ead/Ea22-like family protein [Salmonella enterica]|nr:ead/Ea22-like family protein [Salmonella enterica]